MKIENFLIFLKGNATSFPQNQHHFGPESMIKHRRDGDKTSFELFVCAARTREHSWAEKEESKKQKNLGSTAKSDKAKRKG